VTLDVAIPVYNKRGPGLDARALFVLRGRARCATGKGHYFSSTILAESSKPSATMRQK